MKNTSLITCLLAIALTPSLTLAKSGKGGFMKLDTDGDGAISYTEAEAGGAERLLERFADIDTDSSNSVTREEMHTYRSERKEDARARIKSADADGNGAISYEEASTAGLDKLVEHFDQLDSNGDGEVSREEIQARRKARIDARTRDS